MQLVLTRQPSPYLNQLPATTTVRHIKIDKSFAQVLGELNAGAIVKTIISLGKNLDLNIVAEGAGTEQQVDFLTEHGVNMIQGDYFGKAMDKYDVINFAKNTGNNC